MTKGPRELAESHRHSAVSLSVGNTLPREQGVVSGLRNPISAISLISHTTTIFSVGHGADATSTCHGTPMFSFISSFFNKHLLRTCCGVAALLAGFTLEWTANITR